MAWSSLPANPNILLIITDQQRLEQHWPPGWSESNLPNLHRLRAKGLSFNNAFCAANECSPSRGAFMTSQYPQENGLTQTEPNITLPTSILSLGQVVGQSAAGYQTAWTGKWHLCKGGVCALQTTLLQPYGFASWNPPDAGTTLNNGSTLGGGVPNNDLRIATGIDSLPGQTQGTEGGVGAIPFLRSFDPSKGPFFLVLSLVNPHDVHVYTQQFTSAAVGYPAYSVNMGIGMPPNYADTLSTKPQAQLQFRNSEPPITDVTECGPPDAATLTSCGYVNFYAYLQTVADQLVGLVLNELDALKLTDSTLVIRFADHGEMGMSHGLREKMYVAYEEAIHVPLIFSNPVAFPGPVETDALASLIDLVPTVATIVGAGPQKGVRGTDLTPVLKDPMATVQPAVVYTYDDGQNLVNDADFPGHIRTLRTAAWKYSVWFSELNPFDPAQKTGLPFQFELYDLDTDRGEITNLLPLGGTMGVARQVWQDIHDALTTELTDKHALPVLPFWPAEVNQELLSLSGTKPG